MVNVLKEAEPVPGKRLETLAFSNQLAVNRILLLNRGAKPFGQILKCFDLPGKFRREPIPSSPATLAGRRFQRRPDAFGPGAAAIGDAQQAEGESERLGA